MVSRASLPPWERAGELLLRPDSYFARVRLSSCKGAPKAIASVLSPRLFAKVVLFRESRNRYGPRPARINR